MDKLKVIITEFRIYGDHPLTLENSEKERSWSQIPPHKMLTTTITVIVPLPPEQGGMTMREQQKGLKQNLPSVGNLPTETPLQETLEQAGISPNTSLVWQKIARVPEGGSLKY